MYTGLIIKESIQDEKILDEIEIVKVEIWKTNNTPKYWTAISFTSSCEEFPEHLSKALSLLYQEWFGTWTFRMLFISILCLRMLF